MSHPTDFCSFFSYFVQMYNFTTYAMQLNELHEDQKSKVSHFPLLEKWRESSTVYSSVKMAGKYCNSCTVYSRPSSGREKSANRSNVCSRVYQNDGKNRFTVCSRVYQVGGKNKSVFCLLVHQNIGENLQLIR